MAEALDSGDPLLVYCTGYALGFRIPSGVLARTRLPDRRALLFGIGFWVLGDDTGAVPTDQYSDFAEATGIGVAMMFFFCRVCRSTNTRTGSSPSCNTSRWVTPLL